MAVGREPMTPQTIQAGGGVWIVAHEVSERVVGLGGPGRLRALARRTGLDVVRETVYILR
jgi:hypothetical protein